MPRSHAWIAAFVVACQFAPDRVAAQVPPGDALAQWIAYVERTVPRDVQAFTPELPGKLAKAVDGIEQWAVLAAGYRTETNLDAALGVTRQLLEAKRRVDVLLDKTLQLRVQFAVASANNAPVGEAQRDKIRSFLRSTSRLIDLSGRLRYLQHDALQLVSARFCPATHDRLRLVDLLIEYHSSVGAVATAAYLVDAPAAPPPVRRLRAAAASNDLDELRSRVLRLIAVSGEAALLPNVAKLLERPDLDPALVLQAAETIRQVGLPQTPRADTPQDLPPPAITPRQLLDRVNRLAVERLSRDQRRQHDELVAWLSLVVKQGLTEPSYRLGTFEVRPGDGLLMRNPSPYNLFTDLSPGLFTHVGVVTSQKDADGIERMVIVDLPEHGSRMPATNVEIFLQRTLHYVFLRHPDPQVQQAMAEAARQTIGNETEFDLNFRTNRVLALQGQPLAGRTVRTYCAGLLLLCALQTSADRREFFPLDEFAAPGRTAENLAKLGMVFGEQFISPTGALFSPRLQLVGRREPMYDPAREIEEAVFDHFATGLIDKELVLTPDLFDSLRLKVAEAAKHNSLLSQALLKAAGMSTETDLVAAAKAAAVVETLDEAAFGASADFQTAREAIRAGSIDALKREGLSEADLAAVNTYRKRHAELFQEFERGQLTPRKLRMGLVTYYLGAGQREIDRRFFRGK